MMERTSYSAHNKLLDFDHFVSFWINFSGYYALLPRYYTFTLLKAYELLR